MTEFILELLSEEVPASMQKPAADHLSFFFKKNLKEQNLSYTTCQSYVTPRRLVLHITGLPLQQPTNILEKKGPRVDAPQKAIEGFLSSNNTTWDACIQKSLGSKGTFLFVMHQEGGRPTENVLAELVHMLLQTFPWPKSMRWGAENFSWIRPLKNILLVWNKKKIAFSPPHSLITSTQKTSGHHFLSPEHFLVETFDQYLSDLKKHYVYLDSSIREQHIQKQLHDLCIRYNLELLNDQNLLEIQAGLTEWPSVHLGIIPKGYLQLPPEVLQTCLCVHQKYFTFRGKSTNKFAPYFALVSNNPTTSSISSIIEGNERVLKARLEDALFYWMQDSQHSLEKWQKKLEAQVFYTSLGTMLQKVNRIESLISALVSDEYQAEATLAARFCKADLVSGMVGEFPELQGIMGYYYGMQNGLSPAVCTAIQEHYLPQGSSTKLPGTVLGIALSFADKLDTLCCFFGIDIQPTGSGDPYGLRRLALALIRLIEQNNLYYSIYALADKAFTHHPKLKISKQQAIANLLTFLHQRLFIYLRDQGIRSDYIRTILEENPQDILLIDQIQLTYTLSGFLQTTEGKNLLSGFRRAFNILKEYPLSKEDLENLSLTTPQNSKLEQARAYIKPLENIIFPTPQETDLYTDLNQALLDIDMCFSQEKKAFHKVLSICASLSLTVEAFLDTVRIADKNSSLQKQRVILLKAFLTLLETLGNLQYIEK